jgi:AmmeMemoRadiSam system protein B/AmmeMemoRadiSam system protein A
MKMTLKQKSDLLFLLFIFLFSVFPIHTLASDNKIRKPAVADAFYPGDPAVLKEQVGKFLDNAQKLEIDGKIIGLVVPHAGYPYSGQIDGYGYKQVAGNNYDIIVVLAPSHHDPFVGATIFPGDAYQTPLDLSKIDKTVATALANASDLIKLSIYGHRNEHAVEVQLPFIQTLFPDLPILPMVIGQYDWNTCRKIGETLADVLKSRRPLIVASSDLYHGYSYEECKKTDEKTLAAMTSLEPEALCQGLLNESYFACGGGPVTVMEVAAKKLGANEAKLVARTNSGDVTGVKNGYIVGYGSIVVYKQDKSNPSKRIEYQKLGQKEQDELLKMARQAITEYLQTGRIPRFKPKYKTLEESRGVFVTITKDGTLRGCIGYHGFDRPLYDLVPDRAVQAAFNDPRFMPLRKDELDRIKIKISVYVTNVYEINDISEFEMGRQGIIMTKGNRGATYLPEVPVEAGWKTKQEELESLCQKAGLPKDAWKNGAQFWVYETQVFEEKS